MRNGFKSFLPGLPLAGLISHARDFKGERPIVVTALDSITVPTGHSCLLRTFAAGESFSSFTKLIPLGDGAIVAKFTSYYSSLITSHTTDQIVLDIDNTSLASGKILEIWTRSN